MLTSETLSNDDWLEFRGDFSAGVASGVGIGNEPRENSSQVYRGSKSGKSDKKNRLSWSEWSSSVGGVTNVSTSAGHLRRLAIC
jgi:hypothetical protein